MVNYASLHELKDRLSVTDEDRDAALDMCLEASSRWIEKQLPSHGRFYTVSETRYYTYPRSTVAYWDIVAGGYHSQVLEIDPVTVVTEVAADEDGNGTYERVWTVTTDYWLWPINAPAKGKPYTQIRKAAVSGRYSFPGYLNGIKVTGKFGYADITPADIRELCLQAAIVLARPVLDMAIAGVQNYRIGQELTVTLDPNELPPFARQILESYRSELGIFA